MTEHLDLWGGGDARKETGMQRAWQNAAEDWQSVVLDAVLHLAATREDSFQICEVRGLPGVTEPAKHQAWGSVSLKASAYGWIVPGGAEKSKLTSTNSSRLLGWHGTAKAQISHNLGCRWCH